MIGKLRSLLPYAALAGLAIYLYRDAGRFASAARPGQLGPDFWPRAILVLLLVVCVVELARGAIARRAPHDTAGDARGGQDGDAAASAGRAPWRLAAGIGLTIAYVLALDLLGFFCATAVYLALFMIVGGYRRAGIVLAASLLGSLAFVFVFMKVVYVSLPLGAGPFQALSLAILGALGVR